MSRRAQIAVVVALVVVIAYLYWAPVTDLGVLLLQQLKKGARLVTGRQENARTLAAAVRQFAGELVPGGMLMAIAEHESSFDPSKESNKGAVGWYQFMPEYFGDYGVSSAEEARDPVAATRGLVEHHRPVATWIAENVPGAASDTYVMTFFLYLAHWAGFAGMRSRVGNAKRRNGGVVTTDNVDCSSEGKSHWSGIDKTARRAAWWQSELDAGAV